MFASLTPSSLNASSVEWQPHIEIQNERQQQLFDLLHCHPVPMHTLLHDRRLVYSVLFETDLQILSEAQDLVQKLLADLFRQRELFCSNFLQLELKVADLLALYAHLKPQAGSMVQVPLQVAGKWQHMAYTVERIELTPSWMGSPLVAYGLYTQDSSAPPLLIFKGSTYPADEGAALSLLTDINPFAAVGGYAFAIGKDKIEQWLTRRAYRQKAIVYGKSLGGTQAWRSAIYFPASIQKVMAIATPGCAPWEQAQMQQAQRAHPHLEINFFCQQNDPVPYSDWAACQAANYYEISATPSFENPLLAHAYISSMQQQTTLRRMSPSEIASPIKRTAVTATRLFASLFFPVLAVTYACTCVIRFVYDLSKSYLTKVIPTQRQN